MDDEILMNLSHNGQEYLVTVDGWFRLAKYGVLEEIPPPKNPYETERTEVKDG